MQRNPMMVMAIALSASLFFAPAFGAEKAPVKETVKEAAKDAKAAAAKKAGRPTGEERSGSADRHRQGRQSVCTSEPRALSQSQTGRQSDRLFRLGCRASESDHRGVHETLSGNQGDLLAGPQSRRSSPAR